MSFMIPSYCGKANLISKTTLHHFKQVIVIQKNTIALGDAKRYAHSNPNILLNACIFLVKNKKLINRNDFLILKNRK